MSNKDNKIILIDEQGNEKEFTILFTYHSENFSKDYLIIYDESNEDDLYAYGFNDETKELFPIESEEEYEELEQVIEEFQNSQEN